jgi:outer membrane receptor for ferrienterochelin and colicins
LIDYNLKSRFLQVMKILLFILSALLSAQFSFAQHRISIQVRDANSEKIIEGVVVRFSTLALSGTTDSTGLIIFENITTGRHKVMFSHEGYRPHNLQLSFPLPTTSDTLKVLLSPEEAEALEEVRVTATRSSRTIDNIPTRVEVISGEELEEKGNMKPGDIRMLLAESTGIQTQQTSATSANSSIRIQGLDGKYTQIIRDGFPLYGGFSGGLGLLQIAPLDLKQVEVIKGSSSTLYGGGAIAGLVNLVSKTPGPERQLNLLLNGTSALGLDASVFYAEQFDRVGTTIYAAYNHGTAYDPAGIGLTAIPDFNRFTLNPKVLLRLSDKSTLNFGINATLENRIGGDIEYLKGNVDPLHSYFEKNSTNRYSTQGEFILQIDSASRLVLKNSLSYFDRSIRLPDYQFAGQQYASYTEANYQVNGKKLDWVAGLNFLSDKFSEDKTTSFPVRDYSNTTTGAFIQNTWTVSQPLSLETGVRADYHSDYGFFLLPRFSALWKIDEHFSTRLSAALGYKAPTVFTEEAERIQFKNVLPLDPVNSSAERSHGLNADINYRTGLLDNRMALSINQMVFYTRIQDPILLSSDGNNSMRYIQPQGHIMTRGMETNLKVSYANFNLFVGYTLADVKQQIESLENNAALVSRHRLNNVLMYELEDQWKIGLEAYYFSSQRLNNGARGKAYWTTGFMAEKIWERFSIFINFENLLDTRQTRFDTIYTGSISNPQFNDIYAPLDGFVVNGGLKLQLSGK